MTKYLRNVFRSQNSADIQTRVQYSALRVDMGNTNSSKKGGKGAGGSRQGSAAFGPFSPDEFAQLHDLFKCVKPTQSQYNAHVAFHQCRYM